MDTTDELKSVTDNAANVEVNQPCNSTSGPLDANVEVEVLPSQELESTGSIPSNVVEKASVDIDKEEAVTESPTVQLSCYRCKSTFNSHTKLQDHLTSCFNSLESKPRLFCNVCGKVVAKSYIRNHMRIHSTARFTCTCGRKFLRLYDLKQHGAKSQCSAPAYKNRCFKCHQRFASGSELLKHTHVCTSRRAYRFDCTICEKKFIKLKNLREHEDKFHAGKLPKFKCLYCSSSFKNNKSLKNHSKECSKDAKTCEFCEMVFYDRYSFVEHTESHTGKAKYKCEKCDKTYFTEEYIRSHEKVCPGPRKKPWFKCDVCHGTFRNLKIQLLHKKDVHKINFPDQFHCDLCNKHYTDHQKYQDHLTDNHTEKFPCDVCGKMYTKTILASHKLTHAEKRFICQCGQKFVHKNALTNHKIAKHGAPDIRVLFKCVECPKTFTNKYNLTKHTETIHTGARYSCDKCSATYSYQASLERHIGEKHKPAKSYICQICSKRFVQGASLNRHMKIHQDLRYKCDLCDKTFSQTHPVIKHREKVHPGAKHVEPKDLLVKASKA